MRTSLKYFVHVSVNVSTYIYDVLTSVLQLPLAVWTSHISRYFNPTNYKPYVF